MPLKINEYAKLSIEKRSNVLTNGNTLRCATKEKTKGSVAKEGRLSPLVPSLVLMKMKVGC